MSEMKNVGRVMRIIFAFKI